ncbi:hypothetical protein CEXT_673391 [Caerostris extrusa]|uniref:Uncharacterized protein n=1 Tax=Caerostris extrusa TaxID=172846 RepID=A0AAV4XJ71_CAEEX|nr:hypothetical protein CEXT_673391 [Caerostris extrusa]
MGRNEFSGIAFGSHDFLRRIRSTVLLLEIHFVVYMTFLDESAFVIWINGRFFVKLVARKFLLLRLELSPRDTYLGKYCTFSDAETRCFEVVFHNDPISSLDQERKTRDNMVIGTISLHLPETDKEISALSWSTTPGQDESMEGGRQGVINPAVKNRCLWSVFQIAGAAAVAVIL